MHKYWSKKQFLLKIKKFMIFLYLKNLIIYKFYHQNKYKRNIIHKLMFLCNIENHNLAFMSVKFCKN